MSGIKRHVLVDVLGLLLIATVTTADVQDREAAPNVLEAAKDKFRSLKMVCADGGYQGELEPYAEATGLNLEIVKRSDQAKGFEVLPWRWIVERTFGWLNRSRRLSKNFERNPESSRAYIYIAMIHLMLRRVARA